MFRMLKVMAIVHTSICLPQLLTQTRFSNQVLVIEKDSDFKKGCPGIEMAQWKKYLPLKLGSLS